jgi:geranylgeranyl diphosphate synthase type II
VLLSARACGLDDIERAIPAACAIEMVHTYSLIHDDLPAMDDDDLRRGQPSCHAAFGESTAILAGDALLTQAFQVLAADVRPADAAAGCTLALAQAAGYRNMVGGQADDLSCEAEQGTLEFLESIHRRKTGAMIVASLEMGAIVADADDDQMDRLKAYGSKIGLAFQIVDDLLDWSGDEAALGKRTGKDVDRGKLTFPGFLGEEASRKRATDLIESACEATQSFGEAGEPLNALARYILERNH